MNAIKIETTIQTDGELHLTQLPCRKGDRVEALVLLIDKAALPPGTDDTAESEMLRQEALERFQASRGCFSLPLGRSLPHAR